ncbi:MAG: hypothetical protein J7559_02895 [Cohnella sp.]|nr:hypothetical protein [Cohnella sp.]
MANTYIVTQSDPGNMLIEGQTVTPYHEDTNEIILSIPGAAFDHHIRKNGEYFAKHLKIGGTTK